MSTGESFAGLCAAFLGMWFLADTFRRRARRAEARLRYAVLTLATARAHGQADMPTRAMIAKEFCATCQRCQLELTPRELEEAVCDRVMHRRRTLRSDHPLLCRACASVHAAQKEMTS